MKKWKILFISIAIVVGIGGAFASNYKTCDICVYYDQYWLHNGTYQYAGEEGVDYACVGTAGICTYYKPGMSSPWTYCQFGAFYPLYPLKDKK